MNILSCFKIVPNLDNVLPSDWEEFSLATDLSYAGDQINYFDESALEIGLRIAEEVRKRDKDSFSCAVTVGARPRNSYVKSLYATGYDQVAWIAMEEVEFSALNVAKALAVYAKDISAEVILTGEQAGFEDLGMVPYYLAQELEFPIIPKVEEVHISDNGISITQGGEAKTILDVRSPVVVTIGNSPVTALRSATLMEQMKAGKKDLVEYSVSTNIVPKMLGNFYSPTSNKNTIFLETDQERERQLIQLLRKGG